MSREMEEQEGRIQQEEFKARIVEEERHRLLVEHVARLKEYLPKGVLALPSDLELIETVSQQLQDTSMGGSMGGSRAGTMQGQGRAGTMQAGSAAFPM
jgi:hypothetical protein